MTLASIVLAGLLLTSCGSVEVGPQSRAVGAACIADTDCAKRCLINDRHFPGGMCTMPCATDAECPSGSVCLNQESGVCAVSCRSDADCAGFGRGFACDGEQRPAGGEALVCRVP